MSTQSVSLHAVVVPVAALVVALGGAGFLAASGDTPPKDVFTFITQGGAIAVFAMVFWALLTGKLWIGKTVEQALKTKDEQLATERESREKVEKDRDYWRDMNMDTMRPLAERAFALAEQATSRAVAGVRGDAP